ncbi:MAG: dihydrofolate reductase [Prevotellaceae bacterium]|jgi:dihydrofolate reductase|nr:dihydrofolate reductase [Prevotellaceae bacterium]
MNIAIIAAVADNGAIGRGNRLPWHLAEDLRRFRQLTTGHPVIMGRRTFESIGRPLPHRQNIVLSRSLAAAEPPGVQLAASLADALQAAQGAEEAFVIGGGSIYRQAMPLAQRLYLTHVHTVVADGDAFFPPVSPREWSLADERHAPAGEAAPLACTFATYVRRGN